MLGMLIAMPTVVVIALVDGLTPGNFNMAVLYVVPLVTCAWVRSVRLLWTMCVLLQVLAIGGLFWGPPPDGGETISRFLAKPYFERGRDDDRGRPAALLDSCHAASRPSSGRIRPESATPDGDDEHVVVR